MCFISITLPYYIYIKLVTNLAHYFLCDHYPKPFAAHSTNHNTKHTSEHKLYLSAANNTNVICILYIESTPCSPPIKVHIFIWIISHSIIYYIRMVHLWPHIWCDTLYDLFCAVDLSSNHSYYDYLH